MNLESVSYSFLAVICVVIGAVSIAQDNTGGAILAAGALGIIAVVKFIRSRHQGS